MFTYKKLDSFWLGLVIGILITVIFAFYFYDTSFAVDTLKMVEKQRQIQYKVVECEEVVFEMYWQIRKEPNYVYTDDDETWNKFGDLGCDELLEFDNIDLILMSAELKKIGVIP